MIQIQRLGCLRVATLNMLTKQRNLVTFSDLHLELLQKIQSETVGFGKTFATHPSSTKTINEHAGPSLVSGNPCRVTMENPY